MLMRSSEGQKAIPTPAAALVVLTEAQRSVAAVLTEVDGATVVEITGRGEVSKSSVAKALALLESVGAAKRTIHTDDEIRLADTWSPTPLTSQLLGRGDSADSSVGDDEALPTTPENSDADSGADEEDELVPPELGTLPEPEHVETAELSGKAADTSVSAAAETVQAPERLAPGALGKLVADVLTRNPTIEYTPTMFSHMLQGRSSGAIANALERMVKAGLALRTCEAPKRYRLSGDS